jgi:hypothetical protein
VDILQPVSGADDRHLGVESVLSQRTHAPQQTMCTGCNASLDHLVGAGEPSPSVPAMLAVPVRV